MRLSFVIIFAVTMAACATRYIKPSTVQNPVPTEKFAAFEHFELKRVSLDSAYSQHEANQKAAAKIQEYFDLKVSPLIKEWNQGTPRGQPSRTLLIEPRIEHIKFIGGGARFWVGPIAGSSAVIMKVKYIDKANGKLISEPEFFQRAAAWSGAFTVGGQDNAMLARIVTLVSDYTSRNYHEAVGGPSGASEELVNATE
ncbi:MAG TPA: hypothetical protein VFU31_17355 [Candidatus Binatia bacterium]|nr:hypothetical protein [Candidatus Binatia bacterium]